MQRASTSMVMKTQARELVNASAQTTHVNISCPQCRRQKSIDMAKCWEGDGRTRFTNQSCTECKTIATLGKWFRYKDENEQTISDWLAAIECLNIAKKPEAMRVHLFSCETSREFEVLQTHLQIERDVDSSLPSLHQSKCRRCDAGGTSQTRQCFRHLRHPEMR